MAVCYYNFPAQLQLILQRALYCLKHVRRSTQPSLLEDERKEKANKRSKSMLGSFLERLVAFLPS